MARNKGRPMKANLKQIALTIIAVLIAAFLLRVGEPVVEWLVPEMARANQ